MNIEPKVKALALSAFKRIHLKIQNGEHRDWDSGICKQLQIALLGIRSEVPYEDGLNTDVWRAVFKIWERWPEGSGDVDFPIMPGWLSQKFGVTPINYYNVGWNWSGRRLRQRKKLIQYTIDQLTKENNNA